MEKQFWVIYDSETNRYLRDASLMRSNYLYCSTDALPYNATAPAVSQGFEMTPNVLEARQFNNYEDQKAVCHVQVYFPKARYVRVNLAVHLERN